MIEVVLDFIVCLDVLDQLELDKQDKDEKCHHLEEVPDLHTFTYDHKV